MKGRSGALLPQGAPAVMTMSDLAKSAGVSQSTVSRALAGNTLISAKTRERIQQLARETGFAINPLASALRLQRSNVVAVLITLVHERTQHVSDPFMMAMLAHLADALSDAGYDLLLSKVADHSESWIEQLFRARRPAGAILIGQSLEHEAIERAAIAGLPLVVWGARLPRQSYTTIGTDNTEGGRLAARHLLELGCRRIAFLGNPDLPELAPRLDGFRTAHREAKTAFDPDLVVPCGFDPAAASTAARELLNRRIAVDGIVAGSDVIAMTAIRALHSVGLKIPEDVKVVGFDDVEMAAYASPALTTVRQDLKLGARLLVSNLLKVIAGQHVESVVLPAELIVRESAGPVVNQPNVPRSAPSSKRRQSRSARSGLAEL